MDILPENTRGNTAPAKNRNSRADLLPDERIDDLQRGGYRLIQSPQRFCFGMDAVLLSAFARAFPGERVMDLCSGTGVIPTLMYARYHEGTYTGLEIDAYSADMARRSAAMNALDEKIRMMEGDVKEADRMFSAASFDVVTANPPYMTSGHGLVGASAPLSGARHEIYCSLEDVIRAASYLLRSKGRLYLVHRPFRLAEIIRTLSRFHLEPKRMQLVYPMADREPNMVLIEACKGGKAYLNVEKPLIVYSAPGEYTPQVLEIYRE